MDKLTEEELHERYDRMLDECYEPHPLGYDPSKILKKCDPIAYRCGFNDWLDSEIDETINEIDGEYFDKN